MQKKKKKKDGGGVFIRHFTILCSSVFWKPHFKKRHAWKIQTWADQETGNTVAQSWVRTGAKGTPPEV